MKHQEAFKLWIEIEKFEWVEDDEGQITDVDVIPVLGEPYMAGTYATLQEAQAAAHKFEEQAPHAVVTP